MKTNLALVTGASSGFGWAIAHELAKKKINLIVTARRVARLNELKSELENKYGVSVEVLAFDISNEKETERVLSGAEQSLSTVDILINNAGLAKGVDPVWKLKSEDWNTMIDTNIKGLLHVTRHVLPHMVERNSGHIVNLGSVAGRWTYPGGSVYAATKFAVRAISESLRMDLLGKDIRVTNIEPGMAESEFSEVRFGDSEKAKAVYKGMRPLTPEDIAETVMWCLDRPRHVNIQELVIFSTDQAAISMVHRKS